MKLAQRADRPAGKTVAIYARVSTAEQSTALQLRELRQFAKRRGFTIAKEYVDQVTGNTSSPKRRAVKRGPRRDQAYIDLMNDAVKKHFDCVIVWKFDRFARSLSALIEALQTFAALSIDFVSVTEAIDTTTPMGRLFFHIVGSFAEFEREMIVERVKAGLKNARARGMTLGRPRDREIDAEVRKLAQQGETISAIAREVQRSRAGVRKILTRDPPRFAIDNPRRKAPGRWKKTMKARK